MIVDAHQHFWDPASAEYPWMTDEVAAIRRRFGPEDLEPLLRAHDVVGTVLVQARGSLDETRTLLEIATATPFVLGVVGWIDLTDEGAPALAVRVAVDAHSGLDGVVFAAGVVAFGPVAELQESTLETLLKINTVAPVQLLRSSYPFLLESAGSGRSPFLVNLSAVVAEQPMAGMAAYGASKAAITAFDAAAAREFAAGADPAARCAASAHRDRSCDPADRRDDADTGTRSPTR
jgi:Short-chain dehydrogenases of various substrate specificities